MTLIEEDIPMMALAEESSERQVYAYQARLWMLATLVPGVALLGLAIWLHLNFADIELLVTLPLFVIGFLLLYSTGYSLTADQWLMFDGRNRQVRFHKKNIYGCSDWEYPVSDFTSIRVVCLEGRNQWVLQLEGPQPQRLQFADSAFKKMEKNRAIKLAETLSNLTGIRMEICG
jgi:hypothetical protein